MKKRKAIAKVSIFMVMALLMLLVCIPNVVNASQGVKNEGAISAQRKEKMAEMKEKFENMTEEEKEALKAQRKEKMAEMKEKFENMTEEEKEALKAQRKEKMAEMKEKFENMTEEEKEAMKQKRKEIMSKYYNN